MKIKVALSRKENLDKYQADTVELDFEEYVKGVVPSEIGNALLEACKAQAVAARTFALYKSIHLGQITDQSSKDQAFRASRISSAYPNAMQAVEETAGEVLYYNGKLVETCVYSASNGGRIKSSQEKWGGVRGYLVAKDDPYDDGFTLGLTLGHGVGMSQRGAKNMASLGFTYKEILDFYYPGTELRSNYGETAPAKEEPKVVTKADQLVEWLYSQVGNGYIWGCTGQTATEEFVKARAERYPSKIDYEIVKRWIGKRVYDCCGFTYAGLKNVGIKVPQGVQSQWTGTKWADKGTIDTIPKDKVCCLYRYDSDTKQMGHTGFYLGDGKNFIHASTSKTGVVLNTMKAYEGKWTHWGIPEGLYDPAVIEPKKIEVMEVAYQAEITNCSAVNLRKGPGTTYGIIAAIKCGQVVNVIAVEGDWSSVEWNDKAGYISNKYLTKVPGSESEGKWYVRIECDSEQQAKAIASILAKAQATS